MGLSLIHVNLWKSAIAAVTWALMFDAKKLRSYKVWSNYSGGLNGFTQAGINHIGNGSIDPPPFKANSISIVLSFFTVKVKSF